MSEYKIPHVTEPMPGLTVTVTVPKYRVSARRVSYPPEATCTECGWRTGKGGIDQVRRAAIRHVAETGHTVRRVAEKGTLYEGSSTAP